MLRSVFGRSLASTTAAGSVLALAGLVGPAAVVSVPSLSLVACRDNYPNAVRTAANLDLSDSLVEYGTRPTASVTVSSTTGRPTGSVRFVVDGRSWDVALSGGRASQTLPGNLEANETYTVRARFVPDCATGQFAPSSDSQALTVFKAATRVGPVVASGTKRSKSLAIEAVVGSRSKSPEGEAKVVVSKGRQEFKKKVDVVPVGGGDSLVRATFGKQVRSLGTWDVEVVYLGSDNFKSSRKSTTFTVTR